MRHMLERQIVARDVPALISSLEKIVPASD